MSSLTSTGTALLPRSQCFKPIRSISGKPCNRRQLRITAALPNSLSNCKDAFSNAAKAVMLAAVLSTGMSFAPPDTNLLGPAMADEEATLSPSQRRAAANERRRAILAKARENALNQGELTTEEAPALDAARGDAVEQSQPEQPQPEQSISESSTEQPRRTTSFFDVKPEEPQIKENVKPEVPTVPAPELPKSSLPDKPRFSMPSRPPVETPPYPSLSVPDEVPKTESPALPVPPPAPPKSFQAPAQPLTAATPAPAAPSATDTSSSSSQGFNFDDFLKPKDTAKPTTSPFSAVEPATPQTTIPSETKARLAQQAKQQAAPSKVDKRLAKRHGPPLFLVQLLLTAGIVASLFFAVTKYDGMMANATKLEKFIIGLVEKVQSNVKF